MTVRRSGLSRLARHYGRDTRGMAAAEFALWISVLSVPILSVVDVGIYAFQNMELNNAAQAAAQTAWAMCSPSGLVPAATKCTSLPAAMATIAHTTGLGASAVIQAGSEGNYCLTTAETLQLVGTAGVIPTSGSGTAPSAPVSNCSTQGASFTGNTNPSGDYVQITVNYTYKPVFGGLSVLGLLPATMSRTAWMRLQ